MADFFLASNEGYDLETPRACVRVRRVEGRKEDAFLVVQIAPPLRVKNRLQGWSEVVVAARHHGASLFPVSEWPLAVFIAVPANGGFDAERFDDADLEVVAWGELYPSEDDAKQAVPCSGGRLK
jgi:hypothetical protein